MNKDEEYVRSVWAWAQVRLAEPFEGIAQGKFTMRLPRLPFSQVGFDTEAEAWSAAAEFTRERLEQVWQLREAHNKFRFMCSALAPEEWATMGPVDKLATAELVRLTAGMKPEALA